MEPEKWPGINSSNEIRSVNPRRLRWWERGGWWIAAGVGAYLLLGGFLLVTVPDRLLADWFPTLSDQERAAYLGPAANAVLFALGGVIAVVGVGLSLSRHRQELKAGERDIIRLRDDQEREQARRDEGMTQRRFETERALRERFVTTVNLLSDPAPINRQAALFALGALADDWDSFGKPDEVQVCVEVLTGYLRAPRSGEMLLPLSEEEHWQLEGLDRRANQRTAPQEVSVRQAGYTVIRNHLREDANPRWTGRQVNLSGAEIDFPVSLQGITLDRRGHLNLARARVFGRGYVNLGGMHVSQDAVVNFGGATIAGESQVYFGKAEVYDRGQLNFRSARIIERGSVLLRASIVRAGGYINFGRAEIEHEGAVHLEVVTRGAGGYVVYPDGNRSAAVEDSAG